MQLYQNATPALDNQELIEEATEVLELLAVALAIIAQPGTPAVLVQVMAILGYNCAINWSAMLVNEGGDQ
ncbi:hypothetical protein D3C81_1962400 [compost metagenome]